MTIIDWNGADLPPELRGLPAGKYVIQRADDALTEDEEQGLATALDSLRAGKGIPHDEAQNRGRAPIAAQTFASKVVAGFDPHARVQVEAVGSCRSAARR